MTLTRPSRTVSDAPSHPGETGSTVYDSELRFRALVTASSTTVYRMSPDWQEMRELTGQGFLENTAQPSVRWLEKYIPDEDRAIVVAAIEKAVQDRSIFELEHRVRLPDGRLGWTLSRAVPIFDDEGKIIEWFGAASDVTERHATLARLRTSEAGFKAVADTVPQLVWVTDSNGKLVFFNRRWQEYFGPAGDQQTAAQLAYHCIHPDDVDKTLEAFAFSRKNGTTFEVEHRLRNLDGEYRWFMARANPYVDEDSGKIQRWYGTSVDVHERHNAEDQLRRFNARLEVQVQAGSRDLLAAEAQVRQMQKVEAIGQLTGGVAHDFNNLLTIIRNSAELLGRGELSPDKKQRYLESILDTADRAAKLTGQLLTFARKQALNPEIFSVSEKVERLIEMLRTVVGEQTSIQTQICAGHCYVEADLNQFETALLNLVVNARDAMPSPKHGTINISVSTQTAEEPAVTESKSRISIAVSDEGHGIRPEMMDRIFEPFYTTKEAGKGTGLGLAQVFGFASQSRGEVHVASTLGVGSTFTITLPQARTPARRKEQPTYAVTSRSRRRVLVVEDNTEVGDFTTSLLIDIGYDAWGASDAASAIEILESSHDEIDLVLSDVIMPGMSGVDLGRMAHQRWPHIGLVLTSGYSKALSNEALEGFTFLTKPYSVGQLLAALDSASRFRPHQKRS